MIWTQKELLPRGETWRYPRAKVIPVLRWGTDLPRALGSVAQFVYPTQTREILSGWELYNDGIPDAPTALARRYITVHRGKYPHPQQTGAIESMRPPIYCKPGAGWFVMIDIRRAYESVLRRWGIREVWPRRFFSRVPVYFPPEVPGEGKEEAVKLFYRAFPSVGRSGVISVKWPDGIRRYHRAPLDARPWGTVQVVLSGLAYLAIQLGARYVYVDSFIFPESVPREFIEFARDIGIEFRKEAEGLGYILSAGAYVVGRKMSGHYPRRSSPRAREFNADLGKWSFEVLTKALK